MNAIAPMAPWMFAGRESVMEDGNLLERITVLLVVFVESVSTITAPG